jgi:peptidyl-dipeptidase A
MGHNIYQRAYKDQSVLFQNSANDGFHEAVGDFVALSVTPDYLVKIGLLDPKKVPPASADNALLMKQAMDKIAFLPFGLIVDKWRWQVFSGALTPDSYNSGWWKLRTDYQGIVPPGPRPADAFDAGAKFHIPGNTPYTRYFLARILQFQFHEAACKQAGWTGPLHRCSIYGNKDVGKRLNAMLAMGASKPWPEALEAFTGSREMDAGSVVRYFEPLMVQLKQENKMEKCGW